jgi:hypothetical protein
MSETAVRIAMADGHVDVREREVLDLIQTALTRRGSFVVAAAGRSKLMSSSGFGCRAANSHPRIASSGWSG